MADLTVTVASVAVTSSTAGVEVVQVGEAVTQGEPVYKKASDNKYWLADADASEEAAGASRLVLTPASTDGYAIVARPGASVNVGATLTVGERYYASDTPGGIKPSADLTTGDYVTLVGVAETTSSLKLYFSATGVQVP